MRCVSCAISSGVKRFAAGASRGAAAARRLRHGPAFHRRRGRAHDRLRRRVRRDASDLASRRRRRARLRGAHRHGQRRRANDARKRRLRQRRRERVRTHPRLRTRGRRQAARRPRHRALLERDLVADRRSSRRASVPRRDERPRATRAHSRRRARSQPRAAAARATMRDSEDRSAAAAFGSGDHAAGGTRFPMIDTHAHVHDPQYDDDRGEMLARARAAGVTAVVTIGCDLEDSERALRTAEEHGLLRDGRHPPARGQGRTRRHCRRLRRAPRRVARARGRDRRDRIRFSLQS